MDTLLEQQRHYLEERERILDAMVKEMLIKKSSVREQINSDHRQKQLLNRHIDCSKNLRDLYEDKDGLRKEEIAALSGPNEFAEFYSRLNNIREFHRRHPNEFCVPMSVEFEELDKLRENPADESANTVDFTDEEGYGHFLDLHECYNKYINLKGFEKIDYISYLNTFDQLYEIPKDKKLSEYVKYLQMLLDYLRDYCSRVTPLVDFEELSANIRAEFDKQWENGSFSGWPKETGGALTHSGAHLDLSAFSSWEELASLGLNRLKSALVALGLKCGGTLEERAQRLFVTKGKTIEELPTHLFTKAKLGKSGKAREAERSKEMAFLESQIYRLVDMLSSQRQATKDNVQRKQARTEGEREDSDAEVSDENSEEDDDDVPYNPKNLPLGWDGKPIPYWLYKLHGLNINYNCEICGNCVYKGPKAFQKHFAEWRHAHGMRCLGIPNTAHFANVTQIEDAVALWAGLKNAKEQERWKPDTEEEYEDSIGNVVNKKTYEDLKRQGLL